MPEADDDPFGDSQTEVCTVQERMFLDALYKDFQEYADDGDETYTPSDYITDDGARDVLRKYLVPLLTLDSDGDDWEPGQPEVFGY